MVKEPAAPVDDTEAEEEVVPEGEPDLMQIAQALIDWRELNQHRKDIGAEHLDREIERLEDYLEHNHHAEKRKQYETALVQRKLARQGLKLFTVGG